MCCVQKEGSSNCPDDRDQASRWMNRMPEDGGTSRDVWINCSGLILVCRKMRGCCTGVSTSRPSRLGWTCHQINARNHGQTNALIIVHNVYDEQLVHRSTVHHEIGIVLVHCSRPPQLCRLSRTPQQQPRDPTLETLPQVLIAAPASPTPARPAPPTPAS